MAGARADVGEAAAPRGPEPGGAPVGSEAWVASTRAAAADDSDSTARATAETVETGSVLGVVEDRYGYIIADARHIGEVFFLVGSAAPGVATGDRVSFVVGEHEGRRTARNVTLAERGPPRKTTAHDLSVGPSKASPPPPPPADAGDRDDADDGLARALALSRLDAAAEPEMDDGLARALALSRVEAAAPADADLERALAESIADLRPRDLRDFLRSLGLEGLAERFAEEQVDLEALQLLDYTDLVESLQVPATHARAILERRARLLPSIP